MQRFMLTFDAAALTATWAFAWLGPLHVQAQSVDAVLDQAEQALGGHEMFVGIQAVRIRSHGLWAMPERGIPKTPFETELVFCRPDLVRLMWKFPEELGGVIQFGYDGKDAWSFFGGPPARSKGWVRDVVLQLVAEPQLYLVAPARAEHGEAFALEQAATDADPSSVKVVYRPFAVGKPWNVWFAKDTGELVKLEHDSYQMDGQLALFHSTRSMPKSFAGLNYLTRAKFEAVRAGKIIEAAEETIDAVELNPELPADFFKCPAWDVDARKIDTKEVATETVVKFEHRGPYGEISQSIDRLTEAVLNAGLVPIGAVSGTYLNDPNAVAPEGIRTELAIRVAKVKAAEPVLPSGYVFATQPAMRVAYAYHRGDHWGEDEAHQRLRAWMAERGLQPTGPPRAVWFHDPETTVSDDLITEVQIPVMPRKSSDSKKGAFNPLPLDQPWTRWLVGEWTGVGESDAGVGRGTVRVELGLNGQFVIFTGEAEVTEISAEQKHFLKTQLQASEVEIERFRSSPYRSLEIYTIDQQTGDVVGYLFDSLRCMATGRGAWTANTLTMNWQWSSGHTSTRITEKVSGDRIAAIERIAMPDGSTMEEKGEMVRVK